MKLLATVRDRSTDAPLLEMHLCLVEKHVMGAPTYDAHDYHPRRGWNRYSYSDDEESEDESDGGDREMDEIHDTSISTAFWVGEKGKRVNFRLGVNLDEELLGEEELFEEDSGPDKQEYEGYTGNAGPTLEYWYYSSLLVIWPKSRSIKVACQAGFDEALSIVEDEFENKFPNAERSLSQLIHYANARSVNMSDTTVGRLFRICPSVEYLNRVIALITKVHTFTPTYNWQSTKTFRIGLGGLKTVQELNAAMKKFELSAISKNLFTLVESLGISSINLSATFASQLKVDGIDPTFVDHIVAMVTAKIVSAISTDLSTCQRFMTEILGFLCLFDCGLPVIKQLISHASSFSFSTYACISAFTLRMVLPPSTCPSLPILETSKPLLMELLAASPHAAGREGSDKLSSADLIAVLKDCLGLKRAGVDGAEGVLSKLVDTLIAKQKSQGLLRSICADIELSSAVKSGGEEALLRLFMLRIQQISTVEPVFSWCMPYASMPSHLDVQNFLRGPNPSYVVRGLSGISHARNFRHRYCNGQVQNGFSMSGHEGGRGNSAWVELTKTKNYFAEVKKQFRAGMEERKKLMQLLGIQPDTNTKKRPAVNTSSSGPSSGEADKTNSLVIPVQEVRMTNVLTTPAAKKQKLIKDEVIDLITP